MTAEISSVEGLDALLHPSSIALVGASERSNWARILVDNLNTFEYPGHMHFVNPRYDSLFGAACSRSVAAINEPVDVAIVMTPTAAAEGVVEDCGRKGVRSLVFLTAGFKESGDDGSELEARVARRCRELGMTLLGPNCLGFINYRDRVPAHALTLVPPFVAGSIGMVTQSGAMMLHLHRLFMHRAIGLSYMVSTGNEAGVDATTVIDYLLSDERTTVLAALIEEIRRPREFVEACRRAMDVGKPIVILKTGRSPAAARSAIAHTGALVGSDDVVDGVLRQFGAIRVSSLEEMTETAGMLAAFGWPSGRRFAFVTPSGGACGILSDLSLGTAIEIPDLSDETKARLRNVLPAFATPQNPLDVTGAVVTDPTLLGTALSVVDADPTFDGILLHLDPVREAGPVPEWNRTRMDALTRALGPIKKFKAVSATAATDLTDYGREVAMEYEVHYVNGLAHAIRAIDHSIRYGESVSRHLNRKATEKLREVPSPARSLAAPGVLSEVEAKSLLAEFGIPVPDERLTRTAEDAAAAAGEIGFPVVLKVQSRDLPHKTEAGGVLLNLKSRRAVAAGYEAILRSVRRYGPTVRVDGVLVSRQVQPVLELILGVKQDDRFGPVVMVGLGGTLVEVIRRTSVRIPPIDQLEAEAMLAEAGCTPLLRSVRGRPAGDMSAVINSLVRLGELALYLGSRIRELDINPLCVLPEGSGVVAVDALAVAG